MKLGNNFTLHHLIAHTYICYFTVIRINLTWIWFAFLLCLSCANIELRMYPGGGEVSPRKLVVQSPYQYDVTFHFRASGSLYKSLQSSLRASNVTTAQCFFISSEELVTKQFSKMPASATPHDDNSKTTTVIIYLEGLGSKQQFISNLRQIKTTTQSALTRNTLSQKPPKVKL